MIWTAWKPNQKDPVVAMTNNPNSEWRYLRMLMVSRVESSREKFLQLQFYIFLFVFFFCWNVIVIWIGIPMKYEHRIEYYALIANEQIYSNWHCPLTICLLLLCVGTYCSINSLIWYFERFDECFNVSQAGGNNCAIFFYFVELMLWMVYGRFRCMHVYVFQEKSMNDGRTIENMVKFACFVVYSLSMSRIDSVCCFALCLRLINFYDRVWICFVSFRLFFRFSYLFLSLQH